MRPGRLWEVSLLTSACYAQVSGSLVLVAAFSSSRKPLLEVDACRPFARISNEVYVACLPLFVPSEETLEHDCLSNARESEDDCTNL